MGHSIVELHNFYFRREKVNYRIIGFYFCKSTGDAFKNKINKHYWKIEKTFSKIIFTEAKAI